MARPRNNKKHLALAAEELIRSLARFIDLAGDAMEGGRPTERAHAGSSRDTENGNPVKPKRGPGQGNPKLKIALKRSWANTPKQRKAWIAAMLTGRG